MSEEKVCLRCGTDSKGQVLLYCEVDGEQKWVCTACLPALIHGGH